MTWKGSGGRWLFRGDHFEPRGYTLRMTKGSIRILISNPGHTSARLLSLMQIVREKEREEKYELSVGPQDLLPGEENGTDTFFWPHLRGK